MSCASLLCVAFVVHVRLKKVNFSLLAGKGCGASLCGGAEVGWISGEGAWVCGSCQELYPTVVGRSDLAALFQSLTPQGVHPQEVAPAVTGPQDLSKDAPASTPSEVLNQAFSTFKYFETVRSAGLAINVVALTCRDISRP